MNDWTLETVRGTIIGDAPTYHRYKFYTADGTLVHYDFVHFDTDAEAEAWFKATYPDYYQRGVEMRRWDN